MELLAPRAGESILEVGVGTGVGLRHYPAQCRVTAVDLSAPMMARARARLRRRPLAGVSLCRMDAAHLAMPDRCVDAVYAPYLINVVPDPLAVAREMIRVCRDGGRLVFLNHFDRIEPRFDATDWIVGKAAAWISGVNWQLDFQTFIDQCGLVPSTVERVNVPRVSAVVVCPRPRQDDRAQSVTAVNRA